MSDNQAKIVELEIQIAHVQRLYEQLNEVVTEQAMKADRAQQRLVAMEEQITRLKEKPQAPSDPVDEKPPHY